MKFSLTFSSGKSSISLFLITFICFAAAIRIHSADVFYYNADEAMITSIASGRNLQEVLQFSRFEVHPPLFYIIAHYWMMISDAPAFMRSLSLLFGLLTIIIYYKIGKLLDGKSTGMCCAALIAFSNGCIIQSYVVRHYMLLVFLLSLAMYFYLSWRSRYNNIALSGYAICGMLASFTHFTAIFFVTCITLFELADMYRHKVQPSWIFRWIIANGIIAAAALGIYRYWQPIFVPLASYFNVYNVVKPDLQTSFLIYPLSIFRYVLPGYSLILSLLLIMGWSVFLYRKPVAANNGASLGFIITLGLFALAFGIIFFACGIYPPLGTRRNLWLLPFLVLPSGWIISISLTYALQRILPDSKGLYLLFISLFLLASGSILYNQQLRFSDGSEYVWQQSVWNDFTRYLKKLHRDELIVTEKDDGIMLTNLYPAMKNIFTESPMAAEVPYANTRILFNPYYPRYYNGSVFMATLQEANIKGMLKNADTLIFIRTAWSRSPATDLMLCDALVKKVFTFPSFDNLVNRDTIERARATVLEVSTSIFMAEVMSPSGKAHACLNGDHDMMPGFLPIGKP